MTKFEELTNIISHNKNIDKKLAKKIFDDDKEDYDIELEVSGSESSSAPLVASANEETDPDIIDMLYTNPRHKPNDGSGAVYWDQD